MKKSIVATIIAGSILGMPSIAAATPYHDDTTTTVRKPCSTTTSTSTTLKNSTTTSTKPTPITVVSTIPAGPVVGSVVTTTTTPHNTSTTVNIAEAYGDDSLRPLPTKIVQPIVLTRPTENLAYTGRETTPLVLFGLGLLGTGLIIIAVPSIQKRLLSNKK